MSRLLLILTSATILLSSCASQEKVVVQTEYITKPKLVIQTPEKPVLSKNIEWKVDKDKVYLTRQYFEIMLVDLVKLQAYIDSLHATIESYRSYYETE